MENITNDNGLEALVHISNITHKRISKPQDVLELGQIVKAKVLEVSKEVTARLEKEEKKETTKEVTKAAKKETK